MWCKIKEGKMLRNQIFQINHLNWIQNCLSNHYFSENLGQMDLSMWRASSASNKPFETPGTGWFHYNKLFACEYQ